MHWIWKTLINFEQKNWNLEKIASVWFEDRFFHGSKVTRAWNCGFESENFREILNLGKFVKIAGIYASFSQGLGLKPWRKPNQIQALLWKSLDSSKFSWIYEDCKRFIKNLAKNPGKKERWFAPVLKNHLEKVVSGIWFHFKILIASMSKSK